MRLFQGELALAFGDLLRKLWVPRAMPIAPRTFKMKLANFAPQFSGYSQHDSQVYLHFFLLIIVVVVIILLYIIFVYLLL